jgi:hypothetical protein
MIDPRHQSEIEYLLGRSLTAEELVESASLHALPPDVLEVARLLAHKQLVMCTIYLRAVTQSGGLELQRFVARLSEGRR